MNLKIGKSRCVLGMVSHYPYDSFGSRGFSRTKDGRSGVSRRVIEWTRCASTEFRVYFDLEKDLTPLSRSQDYFPRLKSENGVVGR